MRPRVDDRRRKEFIQRLRLALDYSGLSQNELGRKIGHSGQMVSDWLARGSLPSGEAMLRLPGALGVSGHWLLTGDGTMVAEANGALGRSFELGAKAALAEVRAAIDTTGQKWEGRKR